MRTTILAAALLASTAFAAKSPPPDTRRIQTEHALLKLDVWSRTQDGEFSRVRAEIGVGDRFYSVKRSRRDRGDVTRYRGAGRGVRFVAKWRAGELARFRLRATRHRVRLGLDDVESWSITPVE